MPTCVKRKTTLKQMENVIFRTPSVKLQCKGTSNVVIRFSARLYKYKGNLPNSEQLEIYKRNVTIWKSAIHEFSGTLVPLKLFSKTIFFHPVFYWCFHVSAVASSKWEPYPSSEWKCCTCPVQLRVNQDQNLFMQQLGTVFFPANIYGKSESELGKAK